MIAVEIQSFFENPNAQRALREELERWRGTPFRGGIGAGAAPGVGADCVACVAAVLQRVGAIGEFEWPPYAVNAGDEMLPRMLDVLNGIEQLQLVAFALPPAVMTAAVAATEPGDLLVISSPKLTHLSLRGFDKDAWHCWPCCGVLAASIEDPIPRRCTRAIYRPTT